MGGRLNGGPTMAGTRAGWERELGRWLKPFLGRLGQKARQGAGTRGGLERELGRLPKPFLERLGHKARQRMCPLYVAGLIGPGDRKSVQPMAERFAPRDYD